MLDRAASRCDARRGRATRSHRRRASGAPQLNWKSVVSPSCGLLSPAALGLAQFADSFDTYVTGSVLNGQGGWQQWDSAPNTTTVASNTYAHSTPNSASIWSTGGQTSD